MNDILNIYKRLVDTLIRYYHKDNEPINPLKANRAKSIAKATIVVVLFTKNGNRSYILLRSAHSG